MKGLRWALRGGGHRPSPWSDAGTNRLAVMTLCAVVAIGSTIAFEALERSVSERRIDYSQAVIVAVFTVAYVGLGLQFFLLRAGAAGRTLFVSFLFLAWAVPLIAGAILIGALPSNQPGWATMALSPLVGVALVTGASEVGRADLARLAAIAPPVTLAFLFNFALVATQRKIDLVVRRAESEQNSVGEAPAE
jgi:hypothetical protein